MTAPAFDIPQQRRRRGSALVAVRLRRGATLPSGRICGETDREIHYLASPTRAQQAGTMTTRCGVVLPHDGIDIADLSKPGIPCTGCLVQALAARTGQAGQRWREW